MQLQLVGENGWQSPIVTTDGGGRYEITIQNGPIQGTWFVWILENGKPASDKIGFHSSSGGCDVGTGKQRFCSTGSGCVEQVSLAVRTSRMVEVFVDKNGQFVLQWIMKANIVCGTIDSLSRTVVKCYRKVLWQVCCVPAIGPYK